MGTSSNPGIIPRLCNALIDNGSRKRNPPWCALGIILAFLKNSTRGRGLIRVAFVFWIGSIYTEDVPDLLDPGPHKQSMKVREHSALISTVLPDWPSIGTISASNFISRERWWAPCRKREKREADENGTFPPRTAADFRKDGYHFRPSFGRPSGEEN